MSFKAPRPRRARSQSSSPSKRQSTLFSKGDALHGHCLVLPSEVPKTRRGYGTKGLVQLHNNEVLAEPLGRVFVQQPALHQKSAAAAIHPAPAPALDDSFTDIGNTEYPPIYVSVEGGNPELRHQRHRRKRERQWAKWANETIPLLLQPYLRVLRESDNLRTLDRHSTVILPACSCERRSRISVTCVFFERKLFYFQ
jgi:hypothetical protein